MSDVAAPRESRLAHFPVSFFAVVMGFSGLTLALRASEHALGLRETASFAMLVATAALFIAIACVYLVKAALHPDHVAGEWAHPVRIAFFPAISISLLLIATASAPIAPELARPVWLIGAALQATLTLSVIANWIGHKPYQQIHLNPAWFIPAVGNVVAPVAGAGLGYVELSWLFFSAGMVFWVVLLTLVMNRLIFHDPLPGRMVPTLVILIAPPAVAFIAYLRLQEAQGLGIDAFARILLNIGYVFAGLVLTQAPKIARLPFALSFWALSFPVAALTIASLLFAQKTGSAVHETIGLCLAAFLCLVVAGLVVRTLAAMRAGAVCLPE